MAVYDPESLLIDIENIVKNNLNTKITAINTEKGDSITLASIDSSAYILDIDLKSVNYNPFILTSIVDIESNGIGSATSKIITINVALIHSDNGQDSAIVKRMLRYGRALSEIFEENFYQKRVTGILKIQNLPILSFQKSNSSLVYKVVGLDIISGLT